MIHQYGTPVEHLHQADAPDTSIEAAELVDTSALEKLVHEAIVSFGVKGCISDEIRNMYPRYPYSSITARYAALAKKGYIFYSGKRPGKSTRNQRIMVGSQFQQKDRV